MTTASFYFSLHLYLIFHYSIFFIISKLEKLLSSNHSFPYIKEKIFGQEIIDNQKGSLKEEFLS